MIASHRTILPLDLNFRGELTPRVDRSILSEAKSASLVAMTNIYSKPVNGRFFKLRNEVISWLQWLKQPVGILRLTPQMRASLRTSGRRFYNCFTPLRASSFWIWAAATAL
jgi:hypothetical protein